MGFVRRAPESVFRAHSLPNLFAQGGRRNHAVAKGLPERDVIYKHARPNAMLPVVTLAGFTVVGLMGGVIITETVFNYPGIGAAAAEASAQLDVITVLGFALFNGFILIVANLVVDVLYGVVDPRVRLS